MHKHKSPPSRHPDRQQRQSQQTASIAAASAVAWVLPSAARSRCWLNELTKKSRQLNPRHRRSQHAPRPCHRLTHPPLLVCTNSSERRLSASFLLLSTETGKMFVKLLTRGNRSNEEFNEKDILIQLLLFMILNELTDAFLFPDLKECLV